jgi:hypothetical protein
MPMNQSYAAPTGGGALSQYGDASMFLAEAAQAGGVQHIPSLIWVTPFAILLLCIAILPLIPKTEHWWHQNKN